MLQWINSGQKLHKNRTWCKSRPSNWNCFGGLHWWQQGACCATWHVCTIYPFKGCEIWSKSWFGVMFPSLESEWLFQDTTNSSIHLLILGRKMKWRQNTSTSFNGTRNPSDSKCRNKSENILEMHLFVSFHNLSILSLCVEEPVMTEDGSPCNWSMWRHTSTFSPPRSERIDCGQPYALMAASNRERTVEAVLFVAHFMYTMRREKPSIPPCITILHLMSLWFPSMCHTWFTPSEWYTLLLTVVRLRIWGPSGSTRCMAALILLLGTWIPWLRKWPVRRTSPSFGCCWMMRCT